jgi:hypothetical protein
MKTFGTRSVITDMRAGSVRTKELLLEHWQLPRSQAASDSKRSPRLFLSTTGVDTTSWPPETRT